MAEGKARLKPCPFCGGEAQLDTDIIYLTARCSKCKATVGWWNSPRDAIAAWNRRPTQEPDHD